MPWSGSRERARSQVLALSHTASPSTSPWSLLLGFSTTLGRLLGPVQPLCDIAAYDVQKCFDALWARECVNDLWDAGCQDDKLALLHLENKRAKVAIKNPGGKSEPITIHNVIMQGGVMGSIYCTSTMDKLGKIIYSITIRAPMCHVFKWSMIS